MISCEFLVTTIENNRFHIASTIWMLHVCNTCCFRIECVYSTIHTPPQDNAFDPVFIKKQILKQRWAIRRQTVSGSGESRAPARAGSRLPGIVAGRPHPVGSQYNTATNRSRTVVRTFRGVPDIPPDRPGGPRGTPLYGRATQGLRRDPAGRAGQPGVEVLALSMTCVVKPRPLDQPVVVRRGGSTSSGP